MMAINAAPSINFCGLGDSLKIIIKKEKSKDTIRSGAQHSILVQDNKNML